MNVAQFVNTLDYGGATDYALQLVEGLTEHNHFVYSGQGDDWLDRAVGSGATVHIFSSFQPTHEGARPFSARDLLCLIELVRRLRADRIDALHCHGSKPRLLGMVAAWIARVPVRVQSAHGFSPNPEMNRTLRSLLWVLEWLMALLCTSLVVETDADLAAARRMLPHAQRKIVLIHHGVEEPQIDSGVSREDVLQSIGVDPQSIVAIMACRLAPQKNPMAFVDAVQVLRTRHLDGRLSFIVVGDGPLEREMRQASEEGDLGIHFLGTRRDIWALVWAADILVSPSHWEGLPLVIVNGYLLGTPSLASRVGGIPEVVIPDRTGVLLDDPTAGRVAEALARIEADPRPLEAWGAAGRQLVRENFSPDRMLDAHRNLYCPPG